MKNRTYEKKNNSRRRIKQEKYMRKTGRKAMILPSQKRPKRVSAMIRISLYGIEGVFATPELPPLLPFPLELLGGE